MAITDRDTLTKALAVFQDQPLKDAAGHLLNVLGYRSERSLKGSDSSPRAFLELFSASQTERPFDHEKALVSEWKTADLLFQLTDQELSRESSLFTDTSVKSGLLKSYVFIAIELRGNDYARSKFSAITRQINRIFPMPVMVFFKHGDHLTIAVINRRANKLDESKDVLGKVTLIREINFSHPHTGHLDILASFALPNLIHPQRVAINNFDALHAAWEEIFNVELLNKRFYRELANWYVLYPYDDNSQVIDESELERRYPAILKYLRNCRALLSGRPYFDKSPKQWYELWNQRKKSNFERLRIVTPEISDRNHFARTSKFFGNTKTYHILLRDSSEESYCYFLALLNSSVLEYFYKSITTPQAGGFYAYKTTFLERIPIAPPQAVAREIFATLVPLVELGKKSSQIALPIQFLEDLVDACVMECYFREHIHGVFPWGDSSPLPRAQPRPFGLLWVARGESARLRRVGRDRKERDRPFSFLRKEREPLFCPNPAASHGRSGGISPINIRP